MRRERRAPAGRALGGAVLAATLLLGGCADPPETVTGAAPSGTSAPAPSGAPRAGRQSGAPSSPGADGVTRVALPEEPPSLPPGDPGLDAPAVPDPGVAKDEKDHDDEPLRSVPRTALFDGATVGAILPGAWQEVPARALPCTSVSDAVATRTVGFRASYGRVTQTVATHRDVTAADRAVRRLADSLSSCGWDLGADPRLGSASLAATDGGQEVTAVSVEGVSVVLAGTGGVAADSDRWASLVDLALGSVCPAAPDGCH